MLVCGDWERGGWGEKEGERRKWGKGVMGGKDGGRGVGVMLEIGGEVEGEKKVNGKMGVDLVCLDREDWGTGEWGDVEEDGDSWGLGGE